MWVVHGLQYNTDSHMGVYGYVIDPWPPNPQKANVEKKNEKRGQN